MGESDLIHYGRWILIWVGLVGFLGATVFAAPTPDSGSVKLAATSLAQPTGLVVEGIASGVEEAEEKLSQLKTVKNQTVNPLDFDETDFLKGERRLQAERMVQQALNMGLHRDLQWRRLVRYKKGWFSEESEADSANFFLAGLPGKGDPAEELGATIRGFFWNGVPKVREMHPQCQFPARFKWLKAKMSVGESGLVSKVCPRFEEFRSGLDADSVAVVFSSYYLGSASSTFGHTFLRVRRKVSNQFENRQDLLDQGINYAASVPPDENPLVFALKGMFGGYPGHFSSVPFSFKIREYNDSEARDLWFYNLNLSAFELEMLQAHLWEMGSNFFQYFFFSENCSYHILTAIEAVLPDRDLSSELSRFVIPGETVKALMNSPGLVSSVEYRPSIRGELFARVATLDRSETEVLRLALNDKVVPKFPESYSKDRKAKVLDVAMDYQAYQDPLAGYRETKNKNDNWNRRLLMARAELGVASPLLEVEKPKAEAPHLAHGAYRARLGYSNSAFSSNAVGLGWRFAIHDSLDPQEGFPRYSTIDFLNTSVSFWTSEMKLRLEELNIIGITTLIPAQELLFKPSWSMSPGLRRVQDDNCDGYCIAAFVDGGIGITSYLPWKVGVSYWFADLEISVSPKFYQSKARIGAGPRVGFIVDVSDKVATELQAGYRYFAFSRNPHFYRFEHELRWHLVRRVSVGGEWAYTNRGFEGGANLFVFF